MFGELLNLFKETSFHFVICLALFSIQSFKKAVIGKPLSESQVILNSPPLPPPFPPPSPLLQIECINQFEALKSLLLPPPFPPPLPAIPWGI